MFTIDGDGGTVKIGSRRLGLAPECLVTASRHCATTTASSVIVGIRPEDFEDAALAPTRPADSPRITVQVTLIEALGSEIMVHFSVDAPSVDSGDPDAVEETAAPSTCRTPSAGSTRGRRTRVGDMAEIAVATENMHFFDHETRLAIWE